jgi:hypothetical protein
MCFIPRTVVSHHELNVADVLLVVQFPRFHAHENSDYSRSSKTTTALLILLLHV